MHKLEISSSQVFPNGTYGLAMQLSSYLEAQKITYADFAAQIGAANAGVVHKYASGKRYPRKKFLQAIIRETDGAVTANDFLAEA